MDMFKENPNIGTIKLFTIVIRCFHVDISACESMDLNSVIMFERIIKCFKFMVCLLILNICPTLVVLIQLKSIFRTRLVR